MKSVSIPNTKTQEIWKNVAAYSRKQQKVKNLRFMTMKKSDCLIDPQLMDSHQQRKHRRIMAIADVVKRRGRVKHKRFLAEMQYHGLRKKVAEEYLEVLKDLVMVKFDKGDIVWNGENEPNERRTKRRRQEGEKA